MLSLRPIECSCAYPARRCSTPASPYRSESSTRKAAPEDAEEVRPARCLRACSLHRCGELIEPGTPWDLDHDDFETLARTGPLSLQPSGPETGSALRGSGDAADRRLSSGLLALYQAHQCFSRPYAKNHLSVLVRMKASGKSPNPYTISESSSARSP
jgi:hypothetical protein